jgi:hypothetical protein
MTEALIKLAEEDPTFRCSMTTRPVRRSSPAWVSCTSTSSWTASSASSACSATWAARRLPTARRLRAMSSVEGRFVRQSGGRGQYGHVWLELGPNEPGTGFEFEDKIVGGNRPARIHPCRRARASRKRWSSGVLAGYPVVDVKVSLVDGSYHDVDSSEMAFKIAGSMAFKEGCTEGRPHSAGADHEGRSHGAGRISWAIRWVTSPAAAARSRAWSHARRQCPGCALAGAAERNVRLCHRPALDDQRARQLHDAVREVCMPVSQSDRRKGAQGSGLAAFLRVHCGTCRSPVQFVRG